VKQQATLERRVAKFIRHLEGGSRHDQPKQKRNTKRQ
jgi:hypothetical protein